MRAKREGCNERKGRGEDWGREEFPIPLSALSLAPDSLRLLCSFAHSRSSVAPLKSLYFHWTAICSSSIVFTPRSLFLLFVLLFNRPIVEDLTAAATPPHSRGKLANPSIQKRDRWQSSNKRRPLWNGLQGTDTVNEIFGDNYSTNLVKQMFWGRLGATFLQVFFPVELLFVVTFK